MFTITHSWINEKSLTPEAICRVSGVYETIEEARKGLHLWFMKVPSNGCVPGANPESYDENGNFKSKT